MTPWLQPPAGRRALPPISHPQALSKAQNHRLGTLTYSPSSGITTRTTCRPPSHSSQYRGGRGEGEWLQKLGNAKKNLTEADRGRRGWE